MSLGPFDLSKIINTTDGDVIVPLGSGDVANITEFVMFPRRREHKIDTLEEEEAERVESLGPFEVVTCRRLRIRVEDIGEGLRAIENKDELTLLVHPEIGECAHAVDELRRRLNAPNARVLVPMGVWSPSDRPRNLINSKTGEKSTSRIMFVHRLYNQPFIWKTNGD